MQEIILGDCLEVVKTFPDNHFSAVVTDPPYGLNFMDKKWDHGIPGTEIWAECLRVCKPGGFLLAFGGTRTYHSLTCAIEDAGWEIRDCLMWIYGSGFPKSHNHFGIEGYGTCLKPAYEPIIMAMKPCDGTFKQNAEKWGQAGININACRIATDQNLGRTTSSNTLYEGGWKKIERPNPEGGRWPANILFDEEATKSLDEQSGVLTSGSGRKRSFNSHSLYEHGLKSSDQQFQGSSGGASRFFYCAKASSRERNEGLQALPYQIRGALNATVHGDSRTGKKTIQKNNHPTVKPLKLMEYLIKLISPPKDVLILDPFAGSGTTLLACKNLGISGIGIEKEKEYAEIARKRIEN